MNNEALDKLNTASKMVNHAAARIDDLADAFEDTGNETLAGKLRSLALLLNEASGQIDEGTSAAFSQYLEASNQATDNMLRAALAGVTMTKQPVSPGE
jgi:hypothetical protein